MMSKHTGPLGRHPEYKAPPVKRAHAEWRASAAALALFISSIQISTLPSPRTCRAGLHFFVAAASSFLPGSAFLAWPAAAVAFWVLSLAADLEAAVGFEVELEGCRRRLPSSPAEDEWRRLRPPSSPIGGCGPRSLLAVVFQNKSNFFFQF